MEKNIWSHLRSTTFGLMVGLALLSIPLAQAFPSLELIAETTECNGDTGFTSFNASKLYKIQTGWCDDPNNPGKKLQQVLLKSDSRPGSYDLMWVTQAEAKNIMQQIKEGRAVKIQHLKEPDVKVEIQQNISEKQNKTEPVKQVLSTPKAKEPKVADLRGPSIEIIDPPIANTRSITQVLTAAEIEERTIVGKVDAPAGILSLTVNGEAAKVDDKGFFTASIPIKKNQTSVSVVAVDKQGKRQKFDFNLRQQKPLSETLKAKDTEFGRYHALIIANTQYDNMDNLVTPANDAAVLADIFENKFGFTVTTVKNTSRYELMTALNKMRRDLTEKDNLVIYYAGHGAFDKTNNRGHWLPTDAEADSTANWVSTVAVTDIVNSMSAKHVLLIADSCYSGALMRNSQTQLDGGMSDDAKNAWLRTMAEARTRHLLASGGVKPVLDDGGNGHSIFASALIEVLNSSTGIIDGSQIYDSVKEKVEMRARALKVDQSPLYARLQESEDEFGEFLLIAKE